MKTTAIILGTSRSNGNTALLANKVAKEIGAKVFDINQYTILPFDYDYKNHNDDYLKLIKEVLSYDNIIFASPVYWYGPSAQMKLFLDRINDLLTKDKDTARKFREKTTSLLATGADDEPKSCFEEAFKHIFDYLGIDYQGMLYASCEFDESGINKGANIDISQHLDKIFTFCTSFKKQQI